MVGFSAFLRLMRPVNCLMMGFAVIVGAALVERNVFSGDVLVRLLLGFFAGVFLTGGSMVLNDIVDREIDAVNEPERPIPSGAVSVSQAKTFVLILGVLGFSFALGLGWECLLIAVISWFVLFGYVLWGKRTGFFGNLLVSVCVVIPFVFGGFAVGRGFTEASVIFVVLAFLSNTGREITKGIVDIEGDKRKNVRTVAVRFGSRFAAVLSVIFYVSAVVLSVLPWKVGLVSVWFVPFVMVTDVGLIVSCVWLLRNSSRENARRIKRLILIWFIFGLLAFLAGTIL
ncbi:MAG: geranylgeranylglycerol-phosphate geranylgeranyltransferase [Candidatus Bathyarchaeia archaeon]